MKYLPILITSSVRLVCAASSQPESPASTVQGFDISHWQNYSVDFPAAYNSGARFVVIKATEGNTVVDKKFNEHTSRAASAGFIHGAYHFALPGSGNGSSQASFFLANGGKWKADGMTLPGWLDLEAPKKGEKCYGLSQTDMVAWITGFIDTYSGVTGRFPMIYTSNEWWSTCTGNYKKFSSYCPLVLARYNTSPGTVPGGWSSYTIWQNSNKYAYGGDSDIFNGDESALLNLASGTTTERTFPAESAESATQRTLRNSQYVLSDTSNAVNIPLSIDSFAEMPTTVDDPWNEEKSLTFRDGSVSLLCLCPGNASVNLVTLPWRLGNVLSVTYAYKKHGTRPDPVTGGTIDFYAGVGSGGVHMTGDSDDGHVDITCQADCLAWWSYGKLASGRDSNLEVQIPPPGNIYSMIEGPDKGLRAGAVSAKCIGTPPQADYTCSAGGRDCIYAGGPCIVLFAAFPGQPGYSLTAACVAAMYIDGKSGETGLCAGGRLSVTDLAQIVEYSKVYT